MSTCQLARARGFPFFYAAPIPGLLTGAFPNPLFPPLPLGSVYNRLTYRLADRVALKSYPYACELFAEPRPTYLCCFSPRVVPRPADWGPFAHVTGYWFLDRPAGWRPPQDLVDFLEAGPRPVCIGFGSMLEDDPARLTGLVLDAVARSGQRAVLVSGWGALAERSLPESVYRVESIPYDWLFPRCAAAVHHGGAGTTALALRAGIPAVAVPFGIDQAFWGRRVRQLGAGLGPIPVRRLTAERLAAAIKTAVTDEGLRARASDLGRLIQAEDGVGAAVRIIESVAHAAA